MLKDEITEITGVNVKKLNNLDTPKKIEEE